MKPTRPAPAPPGAGDPVAATAATWVMRHDRGLSPAEQDAFLHWLAADPRHAAEMTRQRAAWEAFDRLAGLQASVPVAPDPDLLAPEKNLDARRAWRRAAWMAVPLAAAAALAFLFWPTGPSPSSPRAGIASELSATPRVPPIEERTLADGSTVRLNRGAVLTVEFSAGERRVRLERGEAAFEVAKDAARPFVVLSGGVAVRAVGTAFNVRLGAETVEVIVTEGRVAVAGGATSPAAPLPPLGAGESAVVPLSPAGGAPQIATLAADDLARRLAWQPRLLTFTDEPLPAILHEFNRRNPVTLRLDDPALRELRLTARFRSDNVDGFLRLLASDFGVTTAAGRDGEILLRATR